MKYAPYSYSKLNIHEQCNRRFKYNYIDKAPQGYVDRTALLKGGAVHSMFEHYPKKSTHKYAEKYKHVFDDFKKSKLSEYLTHDSTREHRIGITKSFQPCSYNDKTAMFRGSVDYISVINNVLHLIDWKTGKLKELKWQDFNQLMFYAIYFFHKYPGVNEIRVSYVYVEHDSENDIILGRQYLDKYKVELVKMIHDTENDIQFKKNPGKLCEYCPFIKHCENDST